MTKILIKNISNTLNYGSAMMAINFIYYTHKAFSNRNHELKIVCDLEDKDHLPRLIKETGLNLSMLAFDYLSYNNRPKMLKMFDLLRRDTYVKFLKKEKFDHVIVLGGDDFSEYYNKLTVTINMLNLNRISSFAKVTLVGQSIGPFFSWRKVMAKRLMKSFNIITRDNTVDYCVKELSLKNVTIGKDLALMHLPMEDEHKNLLDKYKLRNYEYVTIVPSGLAKSYTPILVDYLNEYKIIINHFLQQGKQVVLLAHVFHGESSDSNIIELLEKDFKEYQSVLSIKEILLPSQARVILGQSQLVVSGRMHAAISSLFMGVPAIPLSYSIKYKGVIGESLGLPELIVEEANDPHMWENGEVSKAVLNRVVQLNQRASNPDLMQRINNVKDNHDVLQKMIENIFFQGS